MKEVLDVKEKEDRIMMFKLLFFVGVIYFIMLLFTVLSSEVTIEWYILTAGMFIILVVVGVWARNAIIVFKKER